MHQPIDPVSAITDEWHQFKFHRAVQQEICENSESRDRWRFKLIEVLSTESRMALLMAEINCYWRYHSITDIGYTLMTVNYYGCKCLINNNLLIGEFLCAVRELLGISYVCILNQQEGTYYEFDGEAWRAY